MVGVAGVAGVVGVAGVAVAAVVAGLEVGGGVKRVLAGEGDTGPRKK